MAESNTADNICIGYTAYKIFKKDVTKPSGLINSDYEDLEKHIKRRIKGSTFIKKVANRTVTFHVLLKRLPITQFYFIDKRTVPCCIWNISSHAERSHLGNMNST